MRINLKLKSWTTIVVIDLNYGTATFTAVAGVTGNGRSLRPVFVDKHNRLRFDNVDAKLPRLSFKSSLSHRTSVALATYRHRLAAWRG
jgi:hypothetical protein